MSKWELPKATTPEYMEWDIDRLRREYFKISMEMRRLKAQLWSYERVFEDARELNSVWKKMERLLSNEQGERVND